MMLLHQIIVDLEHFHFILNKQKSYCKAMLVKLYICCWCLSIVNDKVDNPASILSLCPSTALT